MIKKAVVTGASGLIGGALTRRLSQEGVDVLAVDRREPNVSCEALVGDITEPGLLNPYLDERTTLFHLAALTSVPESVRNPRQDFVINVGGTFNLLESVRETNARLVFTSSASVFDPRSPLPHSETAPKSPNSPYAAAKLACEGYCAAYHKCHGLDIKIARLFNVYGPGMVRFAIYDFYRKICEADESFEILGDGRQQRDYIYVDDTAEALLCIAERGAPGEDYNVGTGIPTTSYDLADLICDLMNCEELRIELAGRSFPGDVKAWYADVAKLRSLGFEPSVPLREGLSRTIEWLTSQGTPHVPMEGAR